VKRFDPTREEDRVYLVAFLDNGRITGEEAWLSASDLLPA